MHKILVVVDMQNDFITGSLGTKEAQAIVPNVVAKIKQAQAEGTHIIVTQDTHGKDYLNTNEGKHLPIVHCVEGSNGWHIEPSVYAAVDTAYKAEDKNKSVELWSVHKWSFGSYEVPTEIGVYAGLGYGHKEEVEIEFIGLCTGICVLSNAILAKARFPEATISVDASCCACVTPQSHDTALAAMQLCQIEIKNQGKEPWRK